MRKNNMPTISLISLMVACATLIGCEQEFHRDRNASPRGTGIETFYYPDGGKKVEAWFDDGVPIRTRWYKPDGSLFAETDWAKGENMGYNLRDDGTLAVKGECVDEIMNGKVWIYDESGNLLRETVFRGGVEVGPSESRGVGSHAAGRSPQ